MKAVIFDCDGVLVDSEIIYLNAEIEFISGMGFSVDRDSHTATFMGLPMPAYFEKFYDFYGPQDVTLPEGFKEDFLAHCQKRIDESPLLAIEGVANYVQSINVPMAVASTTNLNRLHEKLKQTALHSLFDPHIYSGQQVPRGKPNPDLFFFAAEKIGIDPQDCIVLEDSVNGVKAGLAAGMTVIGFCGGGHCGPRHADILKKAGAHGIAHSYADLDIFKLARDARSSWA